jgi:hypothetical protein
MASAALRNVGEAVAQRARGDVPGRVRALVAAVAAGTATAALTYRLLRSSGSSGDG